MFSTCQVSRVWRRRVVNDVADQNQLHLRAFSKQQHELTPVKQERSHERSTELLPVSRSRHVAQPGSSLCIAEPLSFISVVSSSELEFGRSPQTDLKDLHIVCHLRL